MNIPIHPHSELKKPADQGDGLFVVALDPVGGRLRPANEWLKNSRFVTLQKVIPGLLANDSIGGNRHALLELQDRL
jgi:hypothetical protein